MLKKALKSRSNSVAKINAISTPDLKRRVTSNQKTGVCTPVFFCLKSVITFWLRSFSWRLVF